jgi:hypothetical protein
MRDPQSLSPPLPFTKGEGGAMGECVDERWKCG